MTDCNDIRKFFHLYYDSEGGAELHFQISDHLATCPQCKAWFAREARTQGLLDDLLARGQVNPSTWQTIEQQLLTDAAVPASRSKGLWMLALAASVIVAVGLWSLTRLGDSDSLGRLAATEHENYVSGSWQAEVVSSSVEEVEQRLRPRAGFAVRCPPRGQAGFELKGGGLCRLKRELGVHIVGEVDRQPVSVFVLPFQSLRAFPQMREHLPAEGRLHECREGRYQMVAGLLHGHVVLVLGRAPRDVLVEILRGYGAHHSGRAAPQNEAPRQRLVAFDSFADVNPTRFAAEATPGSP